MWCIKVSTQMIWATNKLAHDTILQERQEVKTVIVEQRLFSVSRLAYKVKLFQRIRKYMSTQTEDQKWDRTGNKASADLY